LSPKGAPQPIHVNFLVDSWETWGAKKRKRTWYNTSLKRVGEDLLKDKEIGRQEGGLGRKGYRLVWGGSLGKSKIFGAGIRRSEKSAISVLFAI
jgi:hypothetical protein